MIVLLNLLIAIISKTFEEISDTAIETGYKEKVSQIKSMQDSLYGFTKAVYKPMELLFIAKTIQSD